MVEAWGPREASCRFGTCAGLLAGILGICGRAHAAPADTTGPAYHTDTDGDGTISHDEYIAYQTKVFDMMDTSTAHKGMLGKEEMLATGGGGAYRIEEYERWFERVFSWTKVSLVSWPVATSTIQSAQRSLLSAACASSASNQSSAQLKWVGSGQRKSRQAVA